MCRVVLVLLAVAVLGCEGPMGPEGPRGHDGPPGASGISVASSFICGLPITQGDIFAYQAVYSVVEYDDGAVWAGCSVNDADVTSSRSQFYAPGQVGAATHLCSVVHDVDTPSGGYWTFQRDTVGYYARYEDPGSISDRFTVSIIEDLDCVIYEP